MTTWGSHSGPVDGPGVVEVVSSLPDALPHRARHVGGPRLAAEVGRDEPARGGGLGRCEQPRGGAGLAQVLEHQLRCFVAVANDLHFGRAARKLAMLPAALGQVRMLEEDPGARSLERTTRQVWLTEAGMALLEDAVTRRRDHRPLAAAWLRGVRDPHRAAIVATLRDRLASYAKQA